MTRGRPAPPFQAPLPQSRGRAEDDPTPAWARRVFSLGVSSVLVLAAVRALHFASVAYPPSIDAALGAGMRVSVRVMVVALWLFSLQLALAVAVALLLLTRRRACVVIRSGRLFLAPWLLGLAGVELGLNHYLVDLSPDLALVAALSLPWAFIGPWSRVSAFRNARRGLVAVLLGVALWLASALDTGPDRLAALVWGIALLALSTWGAARLGRRERLLAGFALAVAVQLLASQVPLAVPRHGGIRTGDGYAYTFCEIPERHVLYAAVPHCMDIDESCLRGHVAEIDNRSFRTVAKRRFFSPDFYGRLMDLTCLGDKVQVGMARTRIDGRTQRENVLEFDAEHPQRFRKSLFGGDMGQRIVHDADRDALFYGSEWSSRLFRVDRATGRLDRDAGAALGAGGRHWIFPGLVIEGSLVIEHRSLDRRRGSLFAADWLTGSRVMELDLERLERVGTWNVHHGGSSELIVDEDRQRVLVVGLWGLEVIDLRTGRLSHRRRLGFGARLPVVDARHGLVYLPTMAEGKLYILDRDTLRVRHVVATGMGGRNPLLSHDGAYLFSSTSYAWYRWKTLDLASRAARSLRAP